MSKTLGNTIELDVLEKHFTIDAIRYFSLREMVFGQDGRFGYEGLIDRANSDLASGLGNLSSRTLTMIARYSDGRIPVRQIPEDKLLLAKRTGVDTDETTVTGFIEHARDQYLQNFESLSFSRALEVAWSIVARVDKMITDAKPWDLAKDEAQKPTLGAVLYRSAEALRWLSVLLYPVMPFSSTEIWSQLGLPGSPVNSDPASLKWGGLQEGNTIGEVKPIFPRMDKNKVMAEINHGTEPQASGVTQAEAVPTAETKIETTSAPPMQHAAEADVVGVTNFIEIDDFAKVDLRSGTSAFRGACPESR